MNFSRCSSPCPPHLSPNHLQHRGSTAVLHVSAAAAWSDVTAAFIFGFSAAHAQAWPVHVTAHSQTYSLYDKQVNAGIQSIV
ncbi:hypothetical protein SLA2020_380560 [Shorea laevis]